MLVIFCRHIIAFYMGLISKGTFQMKFMSICWVTTWEVQTFLWYSIEITVQLYNIDQCSLYLVTCLHHVLLLCASTRRSDVREKEFCFAILTLFCLEKEKKLNF